jgi:uncharacterized protein YndB with AHSA1/START domain
VNDPIAELERARRTVGNDGAAHVVELRRSYDADVEDVWDACTNPERIPRWLLPISGDLRLGGRFQLEGNASGEITACEPPRRLAVTWVFGGKVSHVSVELSGQEVTELRLRHTVADDDHWAKFGPGAVGVGWDLALLALARHLDGADPPSGGEPTADVMRRSARDWGAAHAAAGVGEATANAAAQRCSAAYAP